MKCIFSFTMNRVPLVPDEGFGEPDDQCELELTCDLPAPPSEGTTVILEHTFEFSVDVARVLIDLSDPAPAYLVDLEEYNCMAGDYEEIIEGLIEVGWKPQR